MVRKADLELEQDRVPVEREQPRREDLEAVQDLDLVVAKVRAAESALAERVLVDRVSEDRELGLPVENSSEWDRARVPVLAKVLVRALVQEQAQGRARDGVLATGQSTFL